VLKRGSAEEREAARLEKERRQQADAAQSEIKRREQERDRLRKEFFKTPAGQARRAFEADDDVFQFEFDVASQAAIIVAMVGSKTATKTSDPTEILNSVCREGWRLLTGSFVFKELGSQSRDKFLSSGQNVAVSGTTVGFYLFERCPDKKRDVGDPWDEGVVAEWYDAETGKIVRQLTE
jgi:hypothetical protein